MTEADFEREASKLLRDLGLPSDTLNFFESESASKANWKSTIREPSPPKVRRVSSSGAAIHRQRDRVANGQRRPDRTSVPSRYQRDSVSKQDVRSSLREPSTTYNRFSTGSPGVPSTISANGSLSQPEPSPLENHPQPSITTTTVQTKRQVHRPAPRAPPPNYKSRRASTPARSSISPARNSSKSPSPAPIQGSGIPIPSQSRLSSSPVAAASTTVSSGGTNAAAANPKSTSASSSSQKHSVKAVLRVNRPVNVIINGSARKDSKEAVESEENGLHGYESIDGNVKSRLVAMAQSSSSSQHKSSSVKKPDASLNAPKHSDITRRLSAPEKSKMQPAGAAASETQQSSSQSSSSRNSSEILRRLSRPARTSKKFEQKSAKEDDKAITNGSKIARPERTSVLSYSRIPVTSPSKPAPPPPTSASEVKSSASSSAGGSKIPQSGVSRATWSGKTRPSQQKQQGKSSEGDTKVGHPTYKNVNTTPSPSAKSKQRDEVLLPEVTPGAPKASISGAYDRLTAKEISMIMQDIDLPKADGKEATPEREQLNGVAGSSSDPFEHLYAKVDKSRKYSDDNGAPQNRHSLTSPISDPGPADSSVKSKRHSADETTRSGSSNPPSRSSSRGQNGRSLSTGSNPMTASSPESVADRQTPDSVERKSKINVNWTKPTLDSNMSAVATSTVQALQTLVEVMSPTKKSKNFSFDRNGPGTPWYLLDTEENDESAGESSHPLSPSGEPMTSPTNMTQSTKVTTRKTGSTGKTGSLSASRPSPERRSSGQMSGSSRRTSNTSNPRSSPPQTSSKKTSLSSQDSPSNRGVHVDTRDQKEARKTSQTGIQPPSSVSRSLSSPEHDYAILEGPESPDPDYDILDPGNSKEFYGYCAHCNKPVIGVETGCLALEDVYHWKCFNCTKCHASLSGQHFYVLDDCIVCEADFLRTLERCHACKLRIQDRVLRACGQCYHPSCFRCVVCGLCLDGVPYIVSNSHKVYCVHDYYRKHAPRCAVCGDSIVPKSGRTKSLKVTASGRNYHIDCYKCEDCGKQLASRGGSEKCYPIERHLYCRECNAARVYQWYKMNSDYQQEPGLIV